MNNVAKIILFGALCFSTYSLQAAYGSGGYNDNSYNSYPVNSSNVYRGERGDSHPNIPGEGKGGYRYEGDDFVSGDGFYYDRSDKNYVNQEHAQMERALHRGDTYPSITTYSPDYNPQNAYKDLPQYRNQGNYQAQQQQGNCPNGKCYQQYNYNTSNQGQGYGNQGYGQPNNQPRGENSNLNAPANRGNNPSADRMRQHSDNDIAQNIRAEISHDADLSEAAKSVSVQVNNGRVTLTGQVQNSAERTKIETLAAQTDGVSGVVNQLTTSQ